MTFKVKDGVQVGSTLVLDSNGYLTTRLATARTIALSGDVSGSASFDGSANINITATVADDSHSHSNYLTGESDTLASVTARGATTSVGVRLGGGTSNPAGTGFSHTLAGVGSNRIVNFDGNGNGTPSVWWTSGSRAYGAIDAQDPGLTFWANNGSSWQKQITLNYGNVVIDTDIRSPIFYDSANTSYYADPNGRSYINQLHTAGGLTVSRSRLSFSSSFDDSNHSVYNNYNNIDGEGSWDGMKMNVYAGFQVRVGNASGTVPATAFFVDGSSNSYAYGSMRSPIFYDSSNTAYYVDPNSISSLYRVNILSGANYSPDRSLGLLFDGGNAGITSWNFNPGGSGSYRSLTFYGTGWNGSAVVQRDILTIGNYGGYVGIWNNSPNYHLDITGTAYAANDFRAPIFYDSNDTSYYADLASGSVLYNLTVRGSNFSMYSGTYGPQIYPTQGGGSSGGGWARSINFADGSSATQLGSVGSLGGVNSIDYVYLSIGGDATNYSSSTYLRLNSGNYTTASGSVRTPILYDLDDTAAYWNGAGGNSRIGRDLYVSGWAGGNYGNRVIIGNTDTSYTIQDTNLRPTLHLHGSYPVISLNHTVTSNGNHGPTLQFTCNGVGNQFVIGTNGTGSQLSMGYSSTSDWNPHNGISGYSGTSFFEATTSGYIGIGAPGDWGDLGGGQPGYHLHFKGFNNAAGGHAAVFQNTVNGTNNGAGFLFQNDNGNHSWGIVSEFRVNGASDRPSILFSSNQTSTTWSVGYGSSDDNFRVNQNHGHRNGSWGTVRLLVDTSGNFYSYASTRSPVYYDSNDTAWYTDPASTSRMRNIDVCSIAYTANYYDAAIEVREYNMEGAGDDTWQRAPRIGFHWGGRVASSIAMSSNGWINIMNNPGTGFESLRCSEFYATGNVTAYYSDERLKTKVGSIEYALDKVKSIETFLYINNDIAIENGFTGTETQVGVSAQSVEKVLPEVVRHAPFDMQSLDGEIVSKTGEWYKTVQYDRLVPLLIEAIKEQQDIIDTQETRIARLEALVQQLIGD